MTIKLLTITSGGVTKILRSSPGIPQNTGYGRLYNWWVTQGAIAPAGWHVSTNAEWIALYTYLGGLAIAGGKLKEIGTAYWNSAGGTNEVLFNGRGGGSRLGGGFTELKNAGVFYTTLGFGGFARVYSLASASTILNDPSVAKFEGYSIRCVLDDPSGWMAGDTVTDIDGNVYRTVKIDTQVWMADNLQVTHYNDGQSIPFVTGNDEWPALDYGAYCESGAITDLHPTPSKILRITV